MKITKNQRISTLERQLAALITLVKMKGYNAIDQRIEALEEFVTYADNMLTELNHALPDPEHDAKCEAQETDVDASLARHRERLGLNKPQLKQLDQSIFDGLDEKWRFAAVDADGAVAVYLARPISNHLQWYVEDTSAGISYKYFSHMKGYDTTDWQNSLIERDTAKELTGSDLCRKMLERGDKLVMCLVSDRSDIAAIKNGQLKIIININPFDVFHSNPDTWKYAAPINNQGEPLTAAEVGL